MGPLSAVQLQTPSMAFAPLGPAIRQLFKFIPYEFVVPYDLVAKAAQDDS